MSDRINIASRFRTARRAIDATQAEIAAKLHVQQSKISDIERGKCTIDAAELSEFSQALGVQTAYFYQADIDANQIFKI